MPLKSIRTRLLIGALGFTWATTTVSSSACQSSLKWRQSISPKGSVPRGVPWCRTLPVARSSSRGSPIARVGQWLPNCEVCNAMRQLKLPSTAGVMAGKTAKLSVRRMPLIQRAQLSGLCPCSTLDGANIRVGQSGARPLPYWQIGGIVLWIHIAQGYCRNLVWAQNAHY